MINEVVNLKLEESKGVRRCWGCKITIRPDVLTVALVRIIECKYSKTGAAGQKEHYCLNCAEGKITEAIAQKLKLYIDIKKSLKKYLQIRKSIAWKDVKEYRNILRIVKNWNHFFAQIVDQEVRKYGRRSKC